MRQKFGSAKQAGVSNAIIIRESLKRKLWDIMGIEKSGYLILMRSVIIAKFRRNDLWR